MRRLALAALAIGALCVAGCQRKAPEPAPEENVEEATPVAPEPAPPPPKVEPPKEKPPVVSDADEPEPDASAQTQEDADAVGMTTRATPRSEDEEAPATNAAVSDSAQ